ncbi:MAG: hypothetical protein JSR27_09390 [Proteobacteria bacterium]|nr:hypothetical protein [Pseudomonadota bacterium]
MSDEINANVEASQSHDCTLFGWLVLIAMIVALVFALHTIFSLRPRVVP